MKNLAGIGMASPHHAKLSEEHRMALPDLVAVPPQPSRGWLEPFLLRVLRVARRCGPLELLKLLLSLGKADFGRDNRTVDTLVVLALASSVGICVVAPDVLRVAPAGGVAIYLFCAWRLLEIQIYTFDVLFAAPLRHRETAPGDTRLSGPIRHLMMRFINYVDMILLFALMNYAIRSQLNHPSIDIIGCIYYSTAIITTLGFGDIAAMGHNAQLLAVAEALFGLFFVVTALSYTVSVVSSLHPLASTRFNASEEDRRGHQ
jgi:hypothetical protein